MLILSMYMGNVPKSFGGSEHCENYDTQHRILCQLAIGLLIFLGGHNYVSLCSSYNVHVVGDCLG